MIHILHLHVHVYILYIHTYMNYTIHVYIDGKLAYSLLSEEGPEYIRASLTAISSFAMVLVAQGNQVKQLQDRIREEIETTQYRLQCHSERQLEVLRVYYMYLHYSTTDVVQYNIHSD